LLSPSPVSKQVCSVCGEGWGAHTKLGLLRVQQAKLDYQEENGYGFDIDYPDAVYDVAEVTVLDCVTVLKNRNRGPVGLTGMTGAPGPAGPAGRSGG
jgi:hypothetical protein